MHLRTPAVLWEACGLPDSAGGGSRLGPGQPRVGEISVLAPVESAVVPRGIEQVELRPLEDRVGWGGSGRGCPFRRPADLRRVGLI
jgi:hypothetical protein